jgi:signal peptidase I
MIQRIRDQRLWAVLLVFLVLGPVFGMLFVNRGWMALAYLLAIAGVAVGVAYAVPGAGEGAIDVAFGLLGLAGILHGIVIAWRRQPDESLRWYARWPGFLALLSIPALLVLIRFTVLEPLYLPSHSMSPTLNAGDLFLASRRAYDFAPPQRGDLIVFSAMGGTPFVKRVIGLPGDRVQLKDGVLYLNDEPVEREEIEPFPIVHGLPMGSYPRFVETLPGGKSYAVLGSNGQSILDSTGLYRVADDCFFVLGDHRSNSHDSRMPDMGCVTEEDILGKVWLRYWNGRTQSLAFDHLE